MLTQDDFKEIKQLIQEEIKHLPTKDQFYSKMDEVMGELKAIREEQTLQSGRQSQNTDDIETHEARISRLEKQAGLPSPTPSTL